MLHTGIYLVYPENKELYLIKDRIFKKQNIGDSNSLTIWPWINSIFNICVWGGEKVRGGYPKGFSGVILVLSWNETVIAKPCTYLGHIDFKLSHKRSYIFP
jgi:hypothetical protein